MATDRSSLATVLLLESRRDVRAIYAEHLRRFQLRVVEVENSAEALAQAWAADAIVTGIRVSGPFDGLELVRRVRADGRTRSTSIIILTACTFENEQHRARSAGCDGFLRKPCLPEQLVAEVDRVLRLRLIPHDVRCAPALPDIDNGQPCMSGETDLPARAAGLSLPGEARGAGALAELAISETVLPLGASLVWLRSLLPRVLFAHRKRTAVRG
jgi:two-component system, cell cycle response regulator DivK